MMNGMDTFFTSEEIRWYVLWEETQPLLANYHPMNEKWATFQWATKKEKKRARTKKTENNQMVLIFNN